MNNSFWTSLERGFCKFALVVCIIGFTIYGIEISQVNEGAGLILIIGGIFIAFASVSFQMMIVEISEKLSEMNAQLNKLIEINSYIGKSIINTDNKGTTNQNQFAGNNPNVKPAVTSTTWDCPGCGTINSNSSRFCQTCGHRKV